MDVDVTLQFDVSGAFVVDRVVRFGVEDNTFTAGRTLRFGIDGDHVTLNRALRFGVTQPVLQVDRALRFGVEEPVLQVDRALTFSLVGDPIDLAVELRTRVNVLQGQALRLRTRRRLD